MKYVIEFSKTGRMAYISHLDLARVFLRAFRMTGLRPAYSQGFNPHPKMSIALPLSLGQSSVCELMEFETAAGPTGQGAERQEYFSQKAAELNERLPEDIRVLSLREKPAEFNKAVASYVAAAEYEILSERISDAKAKLEAFFAAQSIIIEKTSKKTGKVTEHDIRPDMLSYSIRNEQKGLLLCRVVLRAEAGALLNPQVFFNAFIASFPGGDAALAPMITRTAILGKNGEILSGEPQ